MESLNIKDVARLAGVSVSTVSRVLNSYPDVNLKTKRRVMDIIQKYHYVPNGSARNLKLNQSDSIGLLVKGSATPFFTKMINSMECEISSYGYTMILQHVGANENEVDQAIRLSMEKRLLGVIFLGGYFYHQREQLEKMPVPFVFCTTSPVNLNPESFSSVSIDDRQAAREAVEYLYGLGHRKIALITAEECDRSIGLLRLQGYEAALLAHGITPDPALVRHTASFTMESGYEKMKDLLTRAPRFTCILCIADTLAVGACKAVLDAGLRLPQDISVMGFDGTDITRFYNPSICTVCQPDEKMSVKAVEILTRRIKNTCDNRRVLFKTHIQPGGSVCEIAPPAESSPACGAQPPRSEASC